MLNSVNKQQIGSHQHLYIGIIQNINEQMKMSLSTIIKISAKQYRFLLVLHDYCNYLRGFLSIHTFWAQSLRKEGGLSDTTCWTRNLIFMYSRNRFTNPRKCSAVLMFPGTASETPSPIFVNYWLF